MKVINVFGGAGVGKSTLAMSLVSEMKKRGINAEYVSEFAKDLTHAENMKALNDQIYIFGNQHHRMELLREYDVIVTDSPLMLSMVYADNVPSSFYDLVYDTHKGFENQNIIVHRDHPYVHMGRNEDPDKSDYIHSQIIETVYKYLHDEPLFETVSSNMINFVENFINNHLTVDRNTV